MIIDRVMPTNTCPSKHDEYSVNNSMLNPLTAGAAYIRVVIFISTLSTTF